MPAQPGAGRPSKYDPKVHPQLAKWMARCGLIDVQIAKELGIAKSTLNLWKRDYPEFAEALREPKNLVDSLVEDALLRRALGYEVEETEVTADKKGQASGAQEQPKGRVKKLRKHVPPDTTAAIFWLKNRQPGRWRDKQEHELSGPGGGAIPVETTVNLKALSDEELAQLEELVIRASTAVTDQGTGGGGAQ